MIADSCQFGVVSGGNESILFAVVEYERGGNIVHQMQCSDILPSFPAPGSNTASLLRVTIAALLGAKNTFFQDSGIPVGITIGAREWEATNPQKLRDLARKEQEAIAKGELTPVAHIAQHISSQVSISCSVSCGIATIDMG